jgi:hypothetical protein
MPRRRTAYPVSVTTTISPDMEARLEARAALQGMFRADVLRQLIAALPEPSPHPLPAARARSAPPQSPATNTSPSKRISTPGCWAPPVNAGTWRVR